jgi:hypothetical protein
MRWPVKNLFPSHLNSLSVGDRLPCCGQATAEVFSPGPCWLKKRLIHAPDCVTTILLAASIFAMSTSARSEPSQNDDSSITIRHPEPTRGEMLRYKEDNSFGAIKPDEPAKPADTDVYTRREKPPEEVQPASAIPSKEPPRDEDPAKAPGKPKYREIYEKASKQDSSYGDEDSVGVAVGVGFGFKSFTGSLGLTFPMNHYVAWGISGKYMSREEKKLREISYGGEMALILRLPNFTPLTPFGSAGPGYAAWQRSTDDGAGWDLFDQSSSPTAEWAVGASIRLARYVSLIGALRSTTYTDQPPRVYADAHSQREPRNKERLELGFAFGI